MWVQVGIALHVATVTAPVFIYMRRWGLIGASQGQGAILHFDMIISSPMADGRFFVMAGVAHQGQTLAMLGHDYGAISIYLTRSLREERNLFRLHDNRSITFPFRIIHYTI